jgi:putative two-component system response regulator
MTSEPIPVEDVATNACQQGDVLIVDDNPNNLRVLSGMLEQAGYRVRPAASGEMALRSARKVPPDIVLLDIRMPEMDGYEVCRRLKAEPATNGIPVIFISALHEAEDKVNAFRAGGVDYIVKPFQIEEVMARVKTHLELCRARRALQRSYDEMERKVQERTHELVAAEEDRLQALAKTKATLVQMIEAMVIALEKRDPYTAGHQKRVSQLATAIGREMGLPQETIEGIHLGALIHDIGKIYVPAEILTRPGKLTSVEMDLVQTHAKVGHEIIEGIGFPWPVKEMVLQHHERLDGHGYPVGLKDGQIRLEARIIAVADVVEAMASHRPYRAALGIEAALAELVEHRGELYESQVVDITCRLFREGFSWASTM